MNLIGEVPKGFDLAKGVIHEEYVSRNKLLSEFFPRADVIVLVPEKAEGYGIVILEAASFGIPAVVSRIWALSEVVENGKSGFVVSPGSVAEIARAIEKLIVSPALKIKFGKVARKKFMENFWIKVTNKKLHELYTSVVWNKDE